MDSSLEFVVQEKDAGKKLREYLRNDLSFSSRFIRSAAREKRIRINGNIVKLNYIVKNEDKLKIQVAKEESQNILPEAMEIDIIYEDADIIVVNKPPNTVVHPTRSHQSGTLSNGLIYYFQQSKQNCIVRLVSRLDMDTSGLILVAKNQFAHMALARDMKDQDFKKEYLAVVEGRLENEQGTINLPIYRDEIVGIKRIVDERGQESITHYEVVESYKDSQLLKLKLETGRTHQIRVHLSHIGHPIIGDVLYGEDDNGEYIGRQALHASNLSFPHPRTGKVIALEAPLPSDIEKLIKKKKTQL